MAPKILLLIVTPILFLSGWYSPIRSSSADSGLEPAAEIQTEKPTLAEIFKDLSPKNGDSGLLLAFDSDTSKDAESYAQFYDFTEKPKAKDVTNQTIYLTRIGDKIELASKLDYIASPQKQGFLFLGQARYFEPKPRRRNEYLSQFERPDSTTKLFGFDYTRIWKTRRRSDIGRAEKAMIRATKLSIDNEFRRSRHKEEMQNISDYEKVSFMGDGFYVASGYWSQITGGAAFFQAHELNNVVSVSNNKVSGRLLDWYPKQTVLEKFGTTFDKEYRFNEDSKHNDMNYFWSQWKDRLEGKYDDIPTFTLERVAGMTNLTGLVLVPGNAHRSFLASSNFGPAPKKLNKYNNPPLDFEKLKSLYPKLIDVYVSPNQNTVFVLTDTDIIGIDVRSRSELLNLKHGLQFNKVIMIDWALNRFVKKWDWELSN